MSKKLYFVICFVLAVGLNGTALADAIEVNNPSFELDINGVQITEAKGMDVVQGWGIRDTTGWAEGWWLVTSEWPSESYEAADGNASSFSVTAGDPNDANDNCDIYQILDPNLDANSTIAANRRYTLTFNALNCSATEIPSVYGALFYSLGGVNAPPVNDVTLAIKKTTLTSPTWGEPDYAGWEEITLNYTALPGAGSIGERLGVKFGTPYPWYGGTWIAIDNVRVDWLWATDAWNPNPADGAELVSKNPTLTWKPGVWVASTAGHEVYFGTDETAVADANSSDTTGILDHTTRDVNDYTPSGPLELGKTYYWKITEVNSGYSGPASPPPWEGDVWSFRVEGHAYDPSPADGKTDVPFLNQSLTWMAGTEATLHEVYLGTDADDVANADTNSTEWKGNQGGTSYPLTGLMVGETYYWRIDERSAVHPTGLKGDIWKFTVGNFLVVDDYENYANQFELWNVWDDYWVNGLDGIIYLEVDVNTVRELDSQAAELSFFNKNADSGKQIGSRFDVQDLTKLDIGSDWTIGGVKSLFLYVRGDPCNSQVVGDWKEAQPWIELEDTSSNSGYVLHPNPSEMGDDDKEWREWNIDLNDANFSSVELSAIDRFSIGVGGYDKTGQNSKMTGRGYIYIDDIRLYPPRCKTDVAGAAYFNSKGDFSGPDGGIDCTVDEYDLDVMGAEWLVSDYNAQAVPPADPPEVWYRFDDGSGSTVVENSGSWGSDYNIPIGNPPATDEPAWTTDVAPAVDVCDPNYALDFDGTDDDLDIPNSPATNFATTQNMTITTWIKGTPAAWTIFVCSAKKPEDPDRHATGLGIGGAVGKLMYMWNNNYWAWNPELTVPDNQWTFLAVAVEPTQATVYLSDGTTIQAKTNEAEHASLEDFDTDCVSVIGQDAKDSGYFDGIIDDVRLYNKTLTIADIVALAGIDEVYMPNTSVANTAPKTPPPTNYDPNDPDIVNFLDYDVLAGNWLEEFLWP